MAIARKLSPDIELVSADSMQVYRGMDIGTAKPTPRERAEIAHHMIDIVEASEEFSVARFQADVTAALADIAGRGRRAVIVGGTGLYLRSIVDGLTLPGRWPEVKEELESVGDTAALHGRLGELDPVAASRMEPSNRRRIVRALEVTIGSGRQFSTFGPGLDAYPPAPFCLVGLRLAREALDRRITSRVHGMVDAGLVDEVRGLAAAAGGLSKTARQALGYREILRHLEQGAPIGECVEETIRRTRHFARRQASWFGRDPRISWVDLEGDVGPDAPDNPLAVAERVLGEWEQR